MTNLEAHYDDIIKRYEFFASKFPNVPLSTSMLMAISSVEYDNGNDIDGINQHQRLISIIQLLKEPSGK